MKGKNLSIIPLLVFLATYMDTRSDMVVCYASPLSNVNSVPSEPAPEVKTLDIPSDLPGVVIDHSPAASRIYLGSPALAVLPNGEYISKCDEFGPNSSQYSLGVSRFYCSSDAGQTWWPLTKVKGLFWANLFVHHGTLYAMGTDRADGNVVIRKSEDGGHTWSQPKDKNTGLLLKDGKFGTAPVPVVEHDGRLWRAMEDAMGSASQRWGSNFRAFMMSAPVDADLLRADSWTCSNPLASSPAWLDGHFGGWLEGNAVVDPSGEIVDILRVDYREGLEKGAIIRVSHNGTTATFDPESGFIDFPGGCKKFTIRFDPVSGLYWTLSNAILPQYMGHNPERTRNAVALMASENLRTWTIRSIVLYHPDVNKHGFQYLDWLFEGDDIIAVSRTAWDDGQGGANNQHDANFLTFHRVKGFRTRYDGSESTER